MHPVHPLCYCYISKSMASNGKDDAVVPVLLDSLREGVVQEVVVMICKIWDTTNAYGKYLSTDFLVSDRKGNVIQCIAWSNVAHCFVPALEAGTVYTVKHFTLRPNKDTYRVCRHSKYFIQLEGNTVVRPYVGSDAELFNRYPFHPVAIEDIVFVEHKYLIDAVGCVTAVGSAKTSRAGSAYLDCHLNSKDGASIRVTLWGMFCDELLSKQKTEGPNFVALFAGMNVKEYRGECYLSTTSATTIHTTSAIPQIATLKSDLKNFVLPVPAAAREGTIVEILGRGREEKTARAKGRKMPSVTFHCKVVISAIRTKNRWYYYSCNLSNCRKGISRSGGNFFCQSCDKAIEFPQTRYKLQMDVSDDTGSVVVTIFDDLGEKLVGKPADAVLRETGDDVDETILPHNIQSLVGGSVLELKSFTYYDHGPFESFTCTSIVDASSRDSIKEERIGKKRTHESSSSNASYAEDQQERKK